MERSHLEECFQSFWTTESHFCHPTYSEWSCPKQSNDYSIITFRALFKCHLIVSPPIHSPSWLPSTFPITPSLGDYTAAGRTNCFADPGQPQYQAVIFFPGVLLIPTYSSSPLNTVSSLFGSPPFREALLSIWFSLCHPSRDTSSPSTHLFYPPHTPDIGWSSWMAQAFCFLVLRGTTAPGTEGHILRELFLMRHDKMEKWRLAYLTLPSDNTFFNLI